MRGCEDGTTYNVVIYFNTHFRSKKTEKKL